MPILVQGWTDDDEVVTYGSLESEGRAIRVSVEPGEKAAKMMQFVAQHAIFQGPGKPMIQPGSTEWLRKLPIALSGSRFWCVYARRHPHEKHLHGRA